MVTDENDQKVAQIAALLASPARITPAMLRVRIRAICEGIEMPTGRKDFVALAERAGISQPVRYRTWYEERAEQYSAPGALLLLRQVGGGADTCRGFAPAASHLTALYRYFDDADLLLYIGISDMLSGRIAGHTGNSSWMQFAVRSTITRYPSRELAAAAEAEAIEAEHPLFNDQHNNTPEARQRLVEYLIKHDCLDLLAPAVSRG